MSFTINWYVPQRVISLKLDAAVTAEEVLQLNRQAVEYIQTGIQPVHILVDAVNLTEFPTNLRWTIDMLRGNRAVPTGWYILVTENSTVRVIVSAVLHILHQRIHPCATLEEANAFLMEQQISLEARAS